MGKQYNTELQAKVETYMKETGISQAKLAPMMNLSGAVLSQYRRSVYDKGDVGDVERKIREFFQIKEEQAENAKKTESFNAVRGYVATSISESIYKMIRYCQLEKGIVVIDGDAGIGKTKAVPAGQSGNGDLYQHHTEYQLCKKPFKDDCKGVEDFGKPENRRSFHFNP